MPIKKLVFRFWREVICTDFRAILFALRILASHMPPEFTFEKDKPVGKLMRRDVAILRKPLCLAERVVIPVQLENAVDFRVAGVTNIRENVFDVFKFHT
jgi:hypothetical protein